jgi:hypothetical protein
VANNSATDSVLVNPAPAVPFHTVTPCRIVDTRDAAGPYGGPALAANTTREFAIGNICGLPLNPQAVAVNVTVLGATGFGDLRIYPKGSELPNASTINFAPGQVRANNAVIPLTSGWIAVQCDLPASANGTVHFLLDVSGYFN